MGSGGESVSDRFYNAFYKKLLSPDLSTSSKPALFLNLTFKIMKNDPSPNRVLAFVKRLLQLCIYW
jgi:ribosome biogenesis protein MAK21